MEKLDPSKSVQFAFIPKRLEIADNPELEAFPYNILFVSMANIDGVDQSGKALYLPDIATYSDDQSVQYMRYFNQFQKADGFRKKATPPECYNSEDFIELWHFKESGWYEGEKHINGQHFSKSVGKDWKEFFVHLTSVGLAEGEACEFEVLTKE